MSPEIKENGKLQFVCRASDLERKKKKSTRSLNPDEEEEKVLFDGT